MRTALRRQETAESLSFAFPKIEIDTAAIYAGIVLKGINLGLVGAIVFEALMAKTEGKESMVAMLARALSGHEGTKPNVVLVTQTKMATDMLPTATQTSLPTETPKSIDTAVPTATVKAPTFALSATRESSKTPEPIIPTTTPIPTNPPTRTPSPSPSPEQKILPKVDRLISRYPNTKSFKVYGMVTEYDPGTGTVTIGGIRKSDNKPGEVIMSLGNTGPFSAFLWKSINPGLPLPVDAGMECSKSYPEENSPNAGFDKPLDLTALCEGIFSRK